MKISQLAESPDLLVDQLKRARHKKAALGYELLVYNKKIASLYQKIAALAIFPYSHSKEFVRVDRVMDIKPEDKIAEKVLYWGPQAMDLIKKYNQTMKNIKRHHKHDGDLLKKLLSLLI